MTRTLNWNNTHNKASEVAQTPVFDINFVAPYAPIDCAARLKAFVDAQPSFPVNTRIKMHRYKSGNIYFCIQRSFYSLPTYRRYRSRNGHNIGRSNYVKVQVEGYLTGWADSGSTIVVGRGQILSKTYMVNGAFLLLFALVTLLLTTAFLGDFLCIAPFLLLMLISFTHTTLFQPEELGEKYQKTLIRQITTTLHK